ncbi:MAG: FecR family protein [Candidatus Solibacter sp.]
MPLTESAWLRTGPASRLEIELDEGSAWRLGPESQVEISDYARLSTGQRFTVLSLDHGVAYFTGEPGGADTLTLVVPGGQVALLRGARLRMQVDAAVSRISVIEGAVRLSCPAAEIDIREGQTVRLEPANAARFALDREVPAMELDRWNEDRDKRLAASSSAAHVAQRYGVADLDGTGVWVQTDLGAVWKPKVAEDWAPFRNGRWRWYDVLGYTWVSDEAWGWLPYHYGRWLRQGDLGWVWVPAASPVFKPGDVYWLYNAKLAGWGPLAPGEDWQPSAAPQQFLNVNTAYASFHQDARVIDPAGFQSRPQDPLGVATFALALPSPPLVASRLDATRPVLRVGATRVQAVIPGTSFSDTNPETSDVPPPEPPAAVTLPGTEEPPVVSPGPAPDPGPPGPPMQVIYPAPVYTGIVVLNPPEHANYSRPNPNTQGTKGTPVTTTAAPAPAPTASTPSAANAPRDLPRVMPTAPHRETPPMERPSPVPVPAGKELPRVSKPESTPESKPAANATVKVDAKPEVKADAKPDPAQVKKQ